MHHHADRLQFRGSYTTANTEGPSILQGMLSPQHPVKALQLLLNCIFYSSAHICACVLGIFSLPASLGSFHFWMCAALPRITVCRISWPPYQVGVKRPIHQMCTICVLQFLLLLYQGNILERTFQSLNFAVLCKRYYV